MQQNDPVNRLWQASEHSYSENGSICRVCGNPLRQIRLQVGESEKFEIDVCRKCQVFWFDDSELDKIPVPEEPVSLPRHAPNTAIDMSKPMDLPDNMPAFQGDDESFSDYLLAVMGIPVSKDSRYLTKIPWVTAFLILLCTIVFLLEGYFGSSNLINRFGFVPASPLRYYGATIFISAFLHSDFFHFIFNVYFLWLSGKLIEQQISTAKTILLFAVCLISSKLLYTLTTRQPDIPCVGASGFISGFMGCCAVLFPTHKLSFLFRKSRFSTERLWVELPFWFCFLIWFFIQVMLALFKSEDNTAFTSHLGGGLAGIIFAAFCRFGKFSKLPKKEKTMSEKFYGE